MLMKSRGTERLVAVLRILRRRESLLLLALAGAATVVILSHVFHRAPPVSRTSGPLPHAAYVWQRAWDDGVRSAVARASDHVTALHVLAAEVAWQGNRPRVVHVPIDFAALRDTSPSVGLAIRIGPFSGPFAETDANARLLTQLASDTIGRARAAGIEVRELQIDFDAAASKLADYRIWVTALRRAARPVPLIITALPSWLSRAEFRRLAEASDGFVLQVHSLERPQHADDPMTLCDPAAATAAVERAARLGLPFRVALPTYSYLVAFDRDDRFVGLQAEGPPLTWPPDTRLRALRANPSELAALVQTWNADRPAALQGIIWYRLPVAGDALNWHWSTLSSVMSGHTPRAILHATAERSAPGLIDLVLTNDGDADAPLPQTVTILWADAPLLACDALAGYEPSTPSDTTVLYSLRHNTALQWLPPEGRRVLGWLRLGSDTEVQINVTPSPP